mgnify:FL=1
MTTIHRLNPAIDVHTPLGYGKAIAWIDYGPEVNTVWKVVLYESGKPRNFYDDEVLVYPNAMDAEENNLVIPEKWKK